MIRHPGAALLSGGEAGCPHADTVQVRPHESDEDSPGVNGREFLEMADLVLC